MAARKLHFHLQKSESISSSNSDKPSSITHQIAEATSPTQYPLSANYEKSGALHMKSIDKIKAMLNSTSEKLSLGSSLGKSKEIEMLQEISEKNTEILQLKAHIKNLELEK